MYDIIEKIEFSKITKEQLQNKIDEIIEKLPNRRVYLETSDEKILDLWFKNWLHPKLKHKFMKPNPSAYNFRNEKDVKLYNEKYNLYFYENGQFNYDYTVQDIINYIKSEVK